MLSGQSKVRNSKLTVILRIPQLKQNKTKKTKKTKQKKKTRQNKTKQQQQQKQKPISVGQVYWHIIGISVM